MNNKITSGHACKKLQEVKRTERLETLAWLHKCLFSELFIDNDALTWLWV